MPTWKHPDGLSAEAQTKGIMSIWFNFQRLTRMGAHRAAWLFTACLLCGCTTSSLTWVDSDIFIVNKVYPKVMTPEGPRRLYGGSCLSVKLIGTSDEYWPGQFYIGSMCQTRREHIGLITEDYKGSVKIDRARRQVSIRLFDYTGDAFDMNGDYTYQEPRGTP